MNKFTKICLGVAIGAGLGFGLALASPKAHAATPPSCMEVWIKRVTYENAIQDMEAHNLTTSMMAPFNEQLSEEVDRFNNRNCQSDPAFLKQMRVFCWQPRGWTHVNEPRYCFPAFLGK
jgi:hypothetical protein